MCSLKRVLQALALMPLLYLPMLQARSGLPQAAETEIAELVAAAEGGKANAQIMLGAMCESGVALQKDLIQAFRWYLAAAEGGDIAGMYLTGRAYVKGWGVTQDEEEGLRWFHESAKAVRESFSVDELTEFSGSADGVLEAAESMDGRHEMAKAAAGMMYLTGQGVEQSDFEAVRWLKLAMDAGIHKATLSSHQATLMLALMYQEGRGGLPENPVEAMRLYLEVAEARFKLMRWALEMMCADLTGEPDCSAGPQEKPLEGSVAGDYYTSSRGLFTVRIPEPANFLGYPYELWDDFKVGRVNYDIVMLHTDFGEALLATVRKIPEEALTAMATQDSHKILADLTFRLLFSWRSDLPEGPSVVEDTFVETQFGEAIVRVYEAKRGSMITRLDGGGVPEPFDTEIIVMVAVRDNQVICAIDEYDFSRLQGSARTEKGKARIQSFFAGIEVPANPPFDQE